ncbi:unnamed protein product [Medioppia subpectinata]|uniref:GH18 domain-containing protein n=1 Tax=Medioppia subpectinata TaxID=1979941 RepID=A0A7R9Q5S6_9ACAR|nr:unnamed protein product [Medioppia subpectinata]CAG2113649.1 unnamed protein product [Medioppia subpectinata]
MGKISAFLLSSLCLAFITQLDANVIRDNDAEPIPIVCYFGAWAFYHEIDRFDITDIKPAAHLCTHINYGFAKLNETTYEMQVFDENYDIGKSGYDRFIALKKEVNPKLKLMISLGGWYEGSEKYSDMVTNTEMRQKFVKSAVAFLEKYKFDGLDLDWEYPGNRGGAVTDKDNYTKLLQELRAALGTKYLLTAALSPGKATIDAAYNVPELNKLLDWGNLMTYDYHGGFDDYIGHNAPLYSRPDETPELEKKLGQHYRDFNIEYTVAYYEKLGLSKDKMIMGVPFYGRAWSLKTPELHHLHDPVKGMSKPGKISNESGVFGYNEICTMNKASDWHEEEDYYYKAPYAYTNEFFVGFDNERSIQCKVAYMKSLGLKGAMVWSLEFDDFKSHCGDGRQYPLLKKVHAMLNGDQRDDKDCPIGGLIPTVAPTTHTPAPTKPTESPIPTTTQDLVDHYCSLDGFMPDFNDKHKFYQCENIGPHQWRLTLQPCPGDEVWHQELKRCEND